MKALGVDIGSVTTKAVVLDDSGVLCSSIIPSADAAESSAMAAVDKVLEQAGLVFDKTVHIVSTGVGGKSVSFSQQSKAITTCLARGVRYLFPSAHMAIDMGAETITVVKINGRGRLSDWGNQDKCAAGTGIFLQQMAKLMDTSLEEMSNLSLEAKTRAEISTTCAVFAESEVISHVHRVPPTPKAEIVAGIFLSAVRRTMALCKRIGIERDVTVVGGIALNSGMIGILQEEMGFEVLIPEVPQVVAALGAAIIARENLDGGAEG